MSPFKFLERFQPTTTIYVDNGELVFQRGSNEVRGQPFIRIAEDGKIIEVGEPALRANGGRLVRLFDTDGPTDGDAMRAFCRYHMALAADGNLLRPRVTIVEPSFRRAFGRGAATALQGMLRADRFQAEIAESA